MKNIYSILAGLLLTANAFTQPPQKMSYQAVIRNTTNALVTSAQVGMKISVLQGSASGTVAYSETQIPSTNANGLVSLEIGSGTPIIGTFAGIKWANGPYFLKTEIDPTGGTSYSITGTSQLLSVPYALHAKVAESILIDTINNFTIKVSNGVHPYYEVASTNEVYNKQTKQLAIVGATKDNHNPIDPDNDTRALMVHNDDVRKLTKAVVLEPAEATISVLNSAAGVGVDPTLALFQMRDNTKEIIIGNSYNNPLQKNLILLKEAATMQSFTADDGATYRAILFDDNGVQLIKNNTVVHKVDMSGNVTMGDVLNIKPRSTAPSSPTKGTIYFDSNTNKLMVYDGTTWQSCW
jgi:hypothetical protein